MSVTSAFPNFRYSVDDEPNPEWTVEEVFQWCLLQSYKETDQNYNQLIEGLHQQLASGEEELWQAHRQAAATSNDENEAPGNDPSKQSVAEAVEKQASGDNNQKRTQRFKLRVEIVAGEYVGQSYELKPSSKAPCMVGRSKGKKFTTRGISLAKDLEVSTTHGKFEIVNDQVCFTDTGSTNGTRIGGQELETDTPVPITDGLEITCGQTILKVSFL
jgi:hypothetical protein